MALWLVRVGGYRKTTINFRLNNLLFARPGKGHSNTNQHGESPKPTWKASKRVEIGTMRYLGGHRDVSALYI